MPHSIDFSEVNTLLEGVLAILNEDAAKGSHDYKVGDILYSMWGYDQTNIDYYQVVGVTAKGISIREIGKKYVGSSGTEDKVMPVPDSFEGEVLKKVVNQFGRVKIDTYASAGKWDGKPKEQTAAGYGH
jgi:hypothetical protein